MKTLFKGGTIYDGTGARPYVGDVLIEDDRIVKVGKNLRSKADKVIDLKGLQICPGLIDAHSHNDFFYDYDDAEKYYKPFIEQGITTQITGNCSFSPFGVDEDTPFRDKAPGTLEDTLHLLAVIRLMHPRVLLPATTALGTIHPQGREMGIQAGANVVMPNLSPSSVREKYMLYDGKICTGDEAAECRRCMEQRISSVGYRVVVSRGDWAGR
jgi:hypothetical protein